ncbi:MAG: DUF4424 family protein [Bordetella sp.]|uniref:DUF4424 family protein n=1 Tax=Bordetella sp. TaxID=28081 RepID=UPI003F7C853F
MKLVLVLAACVLSVLAAPAIANDSSGFQSTTGIHLSSTADIRMQSEELYISPTRIRIDYVFHNVADHPVTTLVVFPLPDLDLSQGLTAPHWAFPVDKSNFLDFKVRIDGKAIAANLERRAFFHGRDVTRDVAAAGALDMAPWLPGAYERQASALPAAGLARLRRDGLLAAGEDPDTPQWHLRTRYFWTQTFPAGADVRMHQTYRPFVGSALISNVAKVSGRKVVGWLVGREAASTDRYCIDPATRQALSAAQKRKTLGGSVAELEYILTTARNWLGPIGRFHLIIDKGTPANIVSLCWPGLRKTGPTTYEWTGADFVPQRNIALLIFE